MLKQWTVTVCLLMLGATAAAEEESENINVGNQAVPPLQPQQVCVNLSNCKYTYLVGLSFTFFHLVVIASMRFVVKPLFRENI